MIKKKVNSAPARKAAPAAKKPAPKAPASRPAPAAKKPEEKPVVKEESKKPAAPAPAKPAPKAPVSKPAPKAAPASKPTAKAAPVEEPVKEIKIEEPKVEDKPKVTKAAAPVVPAEPAAITEAIAAIYKDIDHKASKVKEFEQKIKDVKLAMEEQYRQVTRLNRIKRMTKMADQPYQWHTIKREASEYMKSNWGEEYQYTSVLYHFEILLVEYHDKTKKFRWGVDVRVKQIKPAIQENDMGDVDYDYGHKKYMVKEYTVANPRGEWFPVEEKGNLDLNKKYASLAEARAAVAAWQERLIADHKEDIDFELNIFNACKEA